jgi:hypothetical protein
MGDAMHRGGAGITELHNLDMAMFWMNIILREITYI